VVLRAWVAWSSPEWAELRTQQRRPLLLKSRAGGRFDSSTHGVKLGRLRFRVWYHGLGSPGRPRSGQSYERSRGGRCFSRAGPEVASIRRPMASNSGGSGLRCGITDLGRLVVPGVGRVTNAAEAAATLYDLTFINSLGRYLFFRLRSQSMSGRGLGPLRSAYCRGDRHFSWLYIPPPSLGRRTGIFPIHRTVCLLFCLRTILSSYPACRAIMFWFPTLSSFPFLSFGYITFSGGRVAGQFPT
jgi:hypothetical protein